MSQVSDPSPVAIPIAAEGEPAASERRTSAVELFWDLVFVFAVTQVTTLLYHHLLGHVAFGWRMLGRIGYLKLAIIAALLILWGVSTGISAWGLMASIAGLLVLLGVIERLPLARE